MDVLLAELDRSESVGATIAYADDLAVIIEGN